MTNQIKEHADNVWSSAKEIARLEAELIKAKAKEKMEMLKQREQEFEQKIAENPITSILIAAGVGVATGILLREIFRRR